MNTTTDLNELQSGKRFTWGKVVGFHKIGEYDIVEYHPHIFINSCGTDKIDYTKTEYSCYIGDKSIGRSADSLDSAIVTCIAYKYDGCNSQSANFFMKMIKPENKEVANATRN